MPLDARASHTEVLQLEEVDSTNAECLRRAAAGARGPLWVTARRQTSGRGRSGRHWTHDEGNLAASLLFVPQAPMAVLHQLSLTTGVAVHDAIIRACGGALPGLRLKWPNDVLIGGDKVGGILVETTTWGGGIVAVVGVGINLATAPAIEGRRTGSLAGLLRDVDRDSLLLQLDATMRDWLSAWDAGAGFAAVRDAWQARTGAIGEPLAVHLGATRLDGNFHGIDDGGALLLRDRDGTVRRLTYGDVTLAGADGPPAERTDQ